MSSAAKRIPSMLWDESLSTGIPSVDQQHREIAAIGAKMLAESRLPLTSEKFGDYFTEFWRMVATHFDAEEKIMRSLDLPSDVLGAHIQEHSELLEKLIKVNISPATLQAGKTVSDIAHELIAIVVDHIVHYDLSLKTFAPET